MFIRQNIKIMGILFLQCKTVDILTRIVSLLSTSVFSPHDRAVWKCPSEQKIKD